MSHFSWCLEHAAPYNEEAHGTDRIAESLTTRNDQGQIVHTEKEVDGPRCANVQGNRGDCSIVESGSNIGVVLLY